ncbi:MAG TPA: class I SAM-dependent methyltransferase [Actinomycetota bacterium]|nr:class I SAM-dependent methyltransferase [Actinomycetota bacterium]
MEGYEPSTYGERWAGIYDDVWQEALDPGPAVRVLRHLAGGGRALELAIGTGRVALPLAADGIEVHGIDVSEGMVERLRRKPGGDAIPVKMGDFADVDVDGEYSLIYVVFNTFFALTTQEDQVRCFKNVASHLAPGGMFVIEAFVPDLLRFDRNQRVQTNSVGLEEVSIETARHDPMEQQISSQHLVVKEGNVEMYPVFIRYAFPAELDLMGQIAGLDLKARYADWDKTPFTAASTSHISVYEKA